MGPMPSASPGSGSLESAPLGSRHALFPGTFDPPTFGHVDLIRRACALFERVTVAIADNPDKHTLFTPAERVELVQAVTADLPRVETVRLSGLVVDGCRELGANVIVRGVRSGTDFDYEVQMARTNRQLSDAVDTVLLAPAPEWAHVSSTLVRQIAGMGGDVQSFVPSEVAARLAERFAG